MLLLWRRRMWFLLMLVGIGVRRVRMRNHSVVTLLLLQMIWMRSLMWEVML